MPSSDTPTSSLSRWHRPRLYATIAAFVQIALSFVPFLLVSSYPLVEGPIGALFFMIGVSVVYFFFALGIGYFLLDSEPHFLGASMLAIPTAIVVGAFMTSNIVDIVGFCASAHPACDSRARLMMPMIGFSVAQLFVAAMILMSWWQSKRKSSLPPDT